jgi:hypothetical protein
MLAVYIALAFAAAAVAFILIGRAARPAPTDEADARTAFRGLPHFEPGEVHAQDRSAITYDPVRNIISIWDKSGGIRMVDPAGVSGWQVNPAIQLFSPASTRKPFFTVAVISDTERAQWRDRLQAAFGGEKELKG